MITIDMIEEMIPAGEAWNTSDCVEWLLDHTNLSIGEAEESADEMFRIVKAERDTILGIVHASGYLAIYKPAN